MTATIHQALHGYSDGHRLIASSLSLPAADARIMVVMSDLSGPGVKAEPRGYLTGYPLEGAGKYVLARTWAAPEMPRPGCVWTHSLIIDNADLAAMMSADDLMSAFRRPTGPPVKSEYSVPDTVSSGPARPISIGEGRVRGIVVALYSAPAQSVIAEVGEAEEDERVVTAIWMQQWPRLRRSFGFCTLAGADRSAKGVPLDLQLVRSPDRQARSKFPDAVTPPDVEQEPALEPLMADLRGGDRSGIREFLRRTGGDVDGGRRAMLPLCRLHASLFGVERPDLSGAVASLATLDSLGTRQARSVRLLIARRAIQEVDDLDNEVFDFVMDTVGMGVRSNEKPIDADRLGRALWRRSPARFITSIDVGGVIGQASANSLPIISTAELVIGLRTDPSLAERIARIRPDVLECAEFWAISEIDDDVASSTDGADSGLVLAALVKAGRAGSTRAILALVDAEEIADVLNEAAAQPVIHAWLRALLDHPDKAAAVLASGRILRRSIVCDLARLGDPDVVPNDYGDDPWMAALRANEKTLDQSEEDFLAAFMMTRALGTRSKSRAELMRFAYTTLYHAFQRDRLPADVQRLATSRLDWGGWFTWDNCSRLRETVVDRFIDRRLDPEVFGRLTEEGNLSTSLIDEAARTGRGRRFLSEVRQRLKDAPEKPMRVRAEYIARKIK